MRVTLQIRGYPRYTKHIGPILAHSEMLAGYVSDLVFLFYSKYKEGFNANDNEQ